MTTTRRTAEALLFDVPSNNKGAPKKVAIIDRPAPMKTSPSPIRCRVSTTYCPRCSGWVEVRLRPVRLRCVACGLEARP